MDWFSVVGFLPRLKPWVSASKLYEAIDGVYYAEDTDDESFRSIMDRFSAESSIEADSYDGTWMVRYEGRVYTAELSYGGFDRNERPVTER